MAALPLRLPWVAFWVKVAAGQAAKSGWSGRQVCTVPAAGGIGGRSESRLKGVDVHIGQLAGLVGILQVVERFEHQP